jgi:hypothetical protein
MIPNPLQETAMTCEDLGALGDLISGFAVIASLIYLPVKHWQELLRTPEGKLP